MQNKYLESKASCIDQVFKLKNNFKKLSKAFHIVGFDIGGNSDIVVHQKNGYLAKPFKTDDLTNGIEWVLYAPNYNKLCVNAREKVLKEFDSTIVAQKYIKLYEEILNEN